MEVSLLETEFAILHWLQGLHGPVQDWLMVHVSFLGNGGWFFIAVGAALLLFRKTRRVGAAILLTLLAGFLVGNLFLKNLVMRPRPCWLEPEVLLLISSPKDFSFPSGHTLASFETAVSIFLYDRRWGTAFLILAALIGFSRLYLFVHFPSDVAAGALLGAFLAWGVHELLEKRKKCDIL